jgi:uncharacterized membrane protein
MTKQLLHSVKTSLNHFLVGVFAILPIYIVVQIFIWLASFVLQSIFDIREWGGHYWITAAVFIAVYGLLVYIDHELSKHRQSLLISLFDLLIERLPFLSSIYRVSKKVIDINTRL